MVGWYGRGAVGWALVVRAMSAAPPTVVTWWAAAVLAHVRPGCKSSLSGARRQSEGFRFPVGITATSPPGAAPPSMGPALLPASS